MTFVGLARNPRNRSWSPSLRFHGHVVTSRNRAWITIVATTASTPKPGFGSHRATATPTQTLPAMIRTPAAISPHRGDPRSSSRLPSTSTHAAARIVAAITGPIAVDSIAVVRTGCGAGSAANSSSVPVRRGRNVTRFTAMIVSQPNGTRPRAIPADACRQLLTLSEGAANNISSGVTSAPTTNAG